ncbi:MAG TPA: hypothetical protein VJH21_00715 [Candidatus Paceibacterota bacterium]
MDILNTFLNANFSFSSMQILFFVLVLVFIGLLLLAGGVLHLGSRLRYLTYPVYDLIIKEAQQKADRIIEDAEEQSRAIRARAQMEGGKILVDRKKEDELFREKHEQQIIDITTHAKEVLTKQTETIHNLSESVAMEFKQYAESAGVLINKELEVVKRSIADEIQRTNKALADMEGKTKSEYESLIKETKKQISEELAKEIKTVRDAVATYRQERFALLDQEITGLVEETARIVLNKTISLKDQEDIVLNALEEAKKGGIFG